MIHAFFLLLTAFMQSKNVELLVANQQSASASILTSAGTMKHVQVGNGPHEAAIAPNAKIGAISVYGDRTPNNKIAIIDLAKDSVINTIDLGVYLRPHGMVFLDNNTIIATSEATKNVIFVDIAKAEVDTVVGTDARGSHMVAVTANKKSAWTANVGDNSVSEIDVVGKKLVRKITVPNQPEGIAVTPDGSEVWVGSNTTGVVSVIDTQTGAIKETLQGMKMPYRLGASPNGKLMTMVDAEGHKLWVANVADHKMIGSIELTDPRGVSISRDSRTAYVTQAGGLVAIVDLVDLTVKQTLTVEASPDGVAVSLN